MNVAWGSITKLAHDRQGGGSLLLHYTPQGVKDSDDDAFKKHVLNKSIFHHLACWYKAKLRDLYGKFCAFLPCKQESRCR